VLDLGPEPKIRTIRYSPIIYLWQHLQQSMLLLDPIQINLIWLN